MKGRSHREWIVPLIRLKQRLSVETLCPSLLTLIPAVLCLLFFGHLLPAINPRIGSVAEVFRLDGSPHRRPGEVWFSVAPLSDSQLVVSTSERRSFLLPSNLNTLSELKAFVTYLRERVSETSVAVGLHESLLPNQVTAVIAADEHLKYEHIRPILYALAQARIHKYAFEVRTF